VALEFRVVVHTGSEPNSHLQRSFGSWSLQPLGETPTFSLDPSQEVPWSNPLLLLGRDQHLHLKGRVVDVTPHLSGLAHCQLPWMVFSHTKAHIEKSQMSTSLLSFRGHPLRRKQVKYMASRLGNNPFFYWRNKKWKMWKWSDFWGFQSPEITKKWRKNHQISFIGSNK